VKFIQLRRKIMSGKLTTLIFGNGRRHVILAALCLFMVIGVGSLAFSQATPRVVHAAVEANLAYSTYVGGISSDEGKDIALDNAGNIYIIGETESDDFLGSGLTISGYSDIFVA
jgi:hypothetical protein